MKCRVTIIVWACLIVIQSFAQQKQIQYLSGTDTKHTVLWDFFCTAGRNSGEWKKIEVPSCWEQQGFGNYNYGRDYKTNGKNFRFYDEKGMYKYAFKVAPSWKGKTVNVVFDASMTDTEVKIPGKSAGTIHQGAFYRFKYDISDLLFFDKPNTLEVTVSKMSADASVNNAERLADYWVFGGIFRPVFLEATPKQFIDYVGIDAKANGKFAMQITIKNLAQNAFVVTTITDVNKKIVSTTKKAVAKANENTILNTQIAKIKTWNSETPNLYTANIALQDAAGKKIYELNEKCRFRTIEIRYGRGVYINGTQVKFKGTNRHCFWPETARALSDEQQLQDVLLLKEMNMNAVDNRFLFLNVNQCTFYWALVNFSTPFDRFDGYIVKQKGTISAPDIAATKHGNLTINLPADYKTYDALVFVAKDNFGKELYKWTSKITDNASLLNNFVTVKNDSTSIKETDSVYTITGGEVSVVLDKKTGNLIITKNTANDYLLSFNNGPVLVKGNASVLSSNTYKDGAEQVGRIYLQWQHELHQMENQWQRLDNAGIRI